MTPAYKSFSSAIAHLRFISAFKVAMFHIRKKVIRRTRLSIFLEPIVKEYGDKYLDLDTEEGAKTLGEITKMTILPPPLPVESQRKLLSRLGS